MENLKTLISFGNNKLPKTTAIFNMGSAMACPSAIRGLCDLADICYAKIPERIYPKTAPQYRNRQAAYWSACTAELFVSQFLDMLSRKRNKVRHLRFNEAGDFYGQDCVQKADDIARELLNVGIQAYIYTSRSDLDFSKVAWLTVNGSNFRVHNEFRAVDSYSGENVSCPGSCKRCSLCTQKHGGVVEVLKH